MQNNDLVFPSLCLGLLIGLFFGAIGGILVSQSHYGKIGTPTIAECEAELPRNQYCEWIAVPKEKTNGN